MIDRIEIFVTALTTRVQRIFSSGSYDTGPAERLLGKPVLVKIYADGVAAGAHFYASTPAHRMMGAAEFLFGLNTTANDPLVPETDFVAKEGHVEVPRGPGLGITINEAALKKHTLLMEQVEK